MEERILKSEDLEQFRQYLIKKEASRETIDKYLRCTREFTSWLSGRALTKELAIEWKEHLRQRGLAAATINSYIAAANALFLCLGGVRSRFASGHLKSRERFSLIRKRSLQRKNTSA